MLSFLDNPDLLNDGFDLLGDIPQRQNSNNSDSSGINTAITDLDHDYSRRTISTSDSGITSDNPASPQYSDTTESVYSSASSPTSMHDEQKAKRQRLSTELYDTVDPTSLFSTEDVIKGLTQDPNFTVDLDGKHIFVIILMHLKVQHFINISWFTRNSFFRSLFVLLSK